MYLFVYGTLRFSNSLIKKGMLKDEFEFVGNGKIKALLYDIGNYPGAVKVNSANEVNGEVFRVLNVKRAFDQLDPYENYDRMNERHCEYIRRRTHIRMDNGEILMAWIYWYNGDLKTKKRIEGNDYLDYLTTLRHANGGTNEVSKNLKAGILYGALHHESDTKNMASEKSKGKRQF